MTRRTFMTVPGVAVLAAKAAAAQQPVYFQIFSQFNDPFNWEFSDWRLKSTLPAVSALRNQYPGSGACLRCDFNGSSAGLFAANEVNSGWVKRVRSGVEQGFLEVAYDGADEPTPRWRPIPNFRGARTAEARFQARYEAAKWFLNEYKDPIWGTPDPDRPGGLKRTAEVFGPLAAISGYSIELGGDTEYVVQFLTMQGASGAVLPGLLEGSTYPARTLHGYGGSVDMLGRMVSLEESSAPEAFWQDGFLRLSRVSGLSLRPVTVYEGPKALQAVLASLDRTRPHVIQIELAPNRMFFKPDADAAVVANSVQYAYERPKSVRVPMQMYRSESEVKAELERENAVLTWLATEFCPANPGSRFLSNGDLKRMAVRGEGPVTPGKVRSLAADLLDRWGANTHPPSFAHADVAEWFTLAETFNLLAESLNASRTGGPIGRALPFQAFGPMEVLDEYGDHTGTVPRTAVIEAAVALLPGLRDPELVPVPRSALPARIEVGTGRVNAAQFLWLMANAVRQPDSRDYALRYLQMKSDVNLMFPTTKPSSETGATWTIKPAALNPRRLA